MEQQVPAAESAFWVYPESVHVAGVLLSACIVRSERLNDSCKNPIGILGGPYRLFFGLFVHWEGVFFYALN